MSSGQEKSTQAIYTGSLLSQELLHPVPINHWCLLCNQNPDYKQQHQRSDLEHLKHTHFSWKSHHRIHNNLWFCTHQRSDLEHLKKTHFFWQTHNRIHNNLWLCTHQRSNLEHLKNTHYSWQTHQKIQNNLWFCLHHQYSEIQEIKKGLHLINIKNERLQQP